MIAYILITITIAHGGPNRADDWPVVTFQRFSDAQACQLASAEIAKRVNNLSMVCVPEASK